MPPATSIFNRWIRPLLMLSLLTCVAEGSAADPAQHSRETEALRQQIRDLQDRVERLEAKIEQGVAVNPALTMEPVAGGWRKQANWKLLTEGMTSYRVLEILGEPQRQKTVSKFEFWEYGDGKVRLYLRRLKSWEIPSGTDAP